MVRIKFYIFSFCFLPLMALASIGARVYSKKRFALFCVIVDVFYSQIKKDFQEGRKNG